jgi:hypothetical protein
LTDIDQSIVSTPNKAKDRRDIKVNQAQEKSSIIEGPTDQIRKKKDGASEPLEGGPKHKIQRCNPDCPFKEQVIVYSATVSDWASVNTTKHLNSKPSKVASGRASNPKGHAQEEIKKKTQEKEVQES